MRPIQQKRADSLYLPPIYYLIWGDVSIGDSWTVHPSVVRYEGVQTLITPKADPWTEIEPEVVWSVLPEQSNQVRGMFLPRKSAQT